MTRGRPREYSDELGRKIVLAWLSQNRSASRTSARLNAEGVRTAQGKRLQPGSIKRFLETKYGRKLREELDGPA